MFPVRYADHYLADLSYDNGFDLSSFPFMVVHHEEIGVKRWFEVYTDGLQNMDTFTRGYIPLTNEMEVDKETPSAMLQVTLQYNLLLVQVEILVHNNDQQHHYFVVRKFWHKTKMRELWICLNSVLDDMQPFIVVSIETFLFGVDGENHSCTNHLMADADVSHVDDTITVLHQGSIF
jgi:hypothetical protein